MCEADVVERGEAAELHRHVVELEQHRRQRGRPLTAVRIGPRSAGVRLPRRPRSVVAVPAARRPVAARQQALRAEDHQDDEHDAEHEERGARR